MSRLNDDLLAEFRSTEDPAALSGGSLTVSAGPLARFVVETPDGNARAFPYSGLVYAHFDPSAGITLVFPDYVVELSGLNLRPLFHALAAQNVATIKVLDLFELPSSRAVVVDKVRVKVEKPKDSVTRET